MAVNNKNMFLGHIPGEDGADTGRAARAVSIGAGIHAYTVAARCIMKIRMEKTSDGVAREIVGWMSFLVAGTGQHFGVEQFV